jgi:hypothetical protein
MFDRRLCIRKPVDIFFNKYLRGYPHLCRSLDLSWGGMRAQALTEPDRTQEAFCVELRLPGDQQSVWVWAHRVWTRERQQAMAFVSMAPPDRERVRRYVNSVQ